MFLSIRPVLLRGVYWLAWWKSLGATEIYWCKGCLWLFRIFSICSECKMRPAEHWWETGLAIPVAHHKIQCLVGYNTDILSTLWISICFDMVCVSIYNHYIWALVRLSIKPGMSAMKYFALGLIPIGDRHVIYCDAPMQHKSDSF